MADARKAIWLIRRSRKQAAAPVPEEADGKAMAKGSHRIKRRARDREEGASSWRALGSLLSCSCRRDVVTSKKYSCRRIVCSGSLCNSVSDGSCAMRLPQATGAEAYKKWAPVASCNNSSRSLLAPSNDHSGTISASFSSVSSASITASSASTSSSSFSSAGGCFRAVQLRKFGCYECHVVEDPVNGPSRDPSMRATVCPCPECGEIFTKSGALEFHQTVRHAVKELGPEDSSRNIIEIIFQSSWLTVQTPSCKIDRILKVHNTKKTLSSFEDYRDSIKSTANKLPKKHPRCIADGNELLRFYCTTSLCSLGLNGSTTLCQSIPRCKVCSIIRDGFKVDASGRIQTMATSGSAHGVAEVSSGDQKRAMLVCRVIAGRVRKSHDATEEYDSVSGSAGAYTNLDELIVFSPKAILPCFVVLYRNV